MDPITYFPNENGKITKGGRKFPLVRAYETYLLSTMGLGFDRFIETFSLLGDRDMS